MAVVPELAAGKNKLVWSYLDLTKHDIYPLRKHQERHHYDQSVRHSDTAVILESQLKV